VTGEEQQRQRAEIAEARPGWQWWAAMVLTATLGPAAAIGVSAWNQHRSEQALCEVVVLSGNAYRSNPAPSATVRELADAMGRLGKKYHCST